MTMMYVVLLKVAWRHCAERILDNVLTLSVGDKNIGDDLLWSIGRDRNFLSLGFQVFRGKSLATGNGSP